ncbi:MAG: efflux RND transporter periplasmic adaptor subunit [Oscillospiraceae bacterium]|nr:efflux RND transporter periplasmic adaptor subunit [Oscillospiraceae bacterium]
MSTVKAKKPKKKLFITLGVIVAVIAVIFAACSAMVGSAKKQMQAAMNAMQTDVVTVRPLTHSIGATGTVISLRSKDVTATLSGVEIADISVEVGDVVEEGQPLVRFDTEDIAKNLQIAQRALSQTQGQIGLSAENAQRQVDDAIRSGEYSADMALNNVDVAYEAYLDAWEALDDAEDAEEAAWEIVDDLEDRYRDLKQTPVEEGVDVSAALAQLEGQLSQAEATARQASAAADQAEKAIDTLYNQYETAQKNYENTIASGQSAVSSAQAAQQSAQLSANTDQQQQQIDALSEQLEKEILTAPFAGIITAVNYDPGDMYMQGALVTVQDCSGYEIRAQIGEYDIPDIALGQKVLIKTDATREQELEGTVVFVSPTATTAAMGMTAAADPTYEVRIRVDTQTDRLRLDMSANLSIIIREEEHALCVPYNAVQTAEDGSCFVEVVNGDETTTVVPVEVVMESSFYTQIQGDVEEGQTVRVISGDATDIFSQMMEMSPMGGGF